MSGTSTQQQSTQSQTAPWLPAQGALQSILSGIGGQIPNAGVNPTQQSALTALSGNAANLQNFQQPATNLANSYLGGDPTGLLNPALKNYQGTVSPIANGSLNPFDTPGFSNALNTTNTDITNQLNSAFAGAGRSGSGLNTQQLARGLAQGDSQAVANQYNQNVQNVLGASGGLLGASGATAGAMTGNQGQGLNIAQSLPGYASQVPGAQLAAQNAAFGLPLNQLGSLENLTVPIAGLGGQSSGSASTQYNPSTLQMLAQLFGGGQNSASSGIAGAGLGGINTLQNLNLGSAIPGFFPAF